MSNGEETIQEPGNASDPDVTYLVEFKDGTKRKITIPANYKVTYGPLAPGSKYNNGGENLALRIYENKEKQRACFVNVTGFRDMSIPVKERVVHVRNERAQRHTPEGVKDFTVQAQYAEWRDPEDEPTSFAKAPQLPKLEDQDEEGVPGLDDDDAF